jgi:trk system potassium uptake protein TrkA
MKGKKKIKPIKDTKPIKTVAVMGLGTFGEQIAKTLYEGGIHILAMDIDQAQVDRMAPWVSKAICADIRNSEVLETQGVFDVDIAIVSLRRHFDTTVLITNALKKGGVEKILVQVDTEQEADAIVAVGATSVVFPQRDMATRIAHQLLSPTLTDYLPVSANISIIDVPIPHSFVGESLISLNLRKKYQMTVLAIRSEENGKEVVSVNPAPDEPLNSSVSLLLMGENRHLDRFKKEFGIV